MARVLSTYILNHGGLNHQGSGRINPTNKGNHCLEKSKGDTRSCFQNVSQKLLQWKVSGSSQIKNKGAPQDGGRGVNLSPKADVSRGGGYAGNTGLYHRKSILTTCVPCGGHQEPYNVEGGGERSPHGEKRWGKVLFQSSIAIP